MKYNLLPSAVVIACLFLFPSLCASLSITSAANTASNLKNYAGAASGLFNNMRTPAALIGGAVVPLGILTAPPLKEEDSPKDRLLKKANLLLAIASLLSEILAITYSTVAINKLAEVKFAPTPGVSELIAENFELAWIGANVHFLFGLFGFGLLVGAKAYFTYGPKVGKVAASWSFAALCQCTSIANGGIAMGSGDADGTGFYFARNLFSLTLKYVRLVVSKAKQGPLPMLAVSFVLYSLFLVFQLVLDAFKPKKEKDA